MIIIIVVTSRRPDFTVLTLDCKVVQTPVFDARIDGAPGGTNQGRRQRVRESTGTPAQLPWPGVGGMPPVQSPRKTSLSRSDSRMPQHWNIMCPWTCRTQGRRRRGSQGRPGRASPFIPSGLGLTRDSTRSADRPAGRPAGASRHG
jgi:hypothetical protein